MADPLAIVLQASGPQTASASGSAVDIGALRSCVKAQLIVSAISGTGAEIEAIVETAPASTGPWLKVASFPKLTVARSCEQVFADCQQFVRLRWVLAGTSPAVTFGATGVAHVLYATLRDTETHGIPKKAIASVPAEERAEHALAASGEAEGYLAGGYTLPLLAWPDELRMQVAQLAVYRTMSRRGFQPEGSDDLIIKNKDDAISWLGKIAKGIIKPPGIQDSTPDKSGSRVRVQTGEARGW